MVLIRLGIGKSGGNIWMMCWGVGVGRWPVGFLGKTAVRGDESVFVRMLTPAIHRGMFFIGEGCEHVVKGRD